MKIGVIAENTNDFVAVARLLKQKFPSYSFFELIKRFTGSNLDDKNNIVLHVLINEIHAEKPDFLLYVRDLDALITDDVMEKTKSMEKTFKKFAKQKPKKSIFMLNIYELEALILADFDNFKAFCKNETWQFDVTKAADTHDPKEVLKAFYTKYNEGMPRDIFPKLNIETIAENHRFFKTFLQDFEKMLQS